jgi:hypothetical protein
MISIINPQLDSQYADVWGEFLPFALQSWIPIYEAGCYVPRWYQAPINSLQNMVAMEYSTWSLQIPPGSFIMEIMHRVRFESVVPPPSGGGSPVFTAGTFQVQITDTTLDYEWFSQPVPDLLFNKQTATGRNGHVLPKPYPVVSPGNFQIERWCTASGSCQLLFAVAVPENVA